MKKIILSGVAAISLCSNAWGTLVIGGGETGCVATTKEYTSCNAGYYLTKSLLAGEGMTCKRCPSYKDGNGNTAYGTTASNNKNGVTSCYIPSGSTFSDETGKGKYTARCDYK